MTDPSSPIEPDAHNKAAAPNEVGQPPPERSISLVSGNPAANRAGKLITLAALLVGCGLFLLATWKHGPPKPDAKRPQPVKQIVTFEPANPETSAKSATPPEESRRFPGSDLADRAMEMMRNSSIVPGLRPDDSDEDDGGPHLTGRQREAAARRSARAAEDRAAQLSAIRAAPLVVYSQRGSGSNQASPSTPQDTAPDRERGPGSELDQLRRGSSIGRASASFIGDRNFLILAGTSVPCILQTAMDTAAPGYVSCLVPQDIYSDNGAVILLEKGTKVLGEYRSGLRQGQRRLFVLWTRAVTPAGVAISLASPASDSLGRAGFDGSVDTHFWERFGGAVMLSVIDSGAYALSDQDAGFGTTRVPSDVAGIALQNSVNIPPSLRKAQGSEVAIFAAQDFDFSAVYGLRSR